MGMSYLHVYTAPTAQPQPRRPPLRRSERECAAANGRQHHVWAAYSTTISVRPWATLPWRCPQPWHAESLLARLLDRWAALHPEKKIFFNLYLTLVCAERSNRSVFWFWFLLGGGPLPMYMHAQCKS